MGSLIELEHNKSIDYIIKDNLSQVTLWNQFDSIYVDFLSIFFHTLSKMFYVYVLCFVFSLNVQISLIILLPSVHLNLN